MDTRIRCILVEETDRYTSYIEGVSSPIYRNVENGEEFASRDLPAGSMYFGTYDSIPKGDDGRTLWVKLPNGDVWCVDGRASNCTKPEDTEHRCWVRHGEAPNITVDKNGNTCSAGAGSIQSGSYHGFLRDGYLEQA